MQIRNCFVGVVSLCLGIGEARAQDTNSVEQLQRELEQTKAALERVIQEYRGKLEDLSRRLAERQPGTGAVTNGIQIDKLLPEAETQAGEEPVPSTSAQRRPGDPLRISRGSAYLDLGLVGTVAVGSSSARDIEGGLQPGGHDPNQRGFTIQGVEATFSGAVDPYFRGTANLLYSLDAEGESFFELEEAYLETISLPANLQLRAGQFYTEFGRQNPLHPHAWAFVDAPLVSARFLGLDGLRNPGARLSWLMPTPFYSELFLSVQNSQGETAASFRDSGGHSHGGDEDALPFAYRHPDNDRGVTRFSDLLFGPRYATSFDLTDTQTLLWGASAAFGPNSSGQEGGGDTETQIYGTDLTWKWKSANHSGGFPFLASQTEFMLRRYEAGAFDWDENGNGLVDPGEVGDTSGRPALLPRERLVDYGLYSQFLYGFRRGWVAGLRFDWLAGDEAEYERMGLLLDGEPLGRDPLRAPRWRLSPNLTWYPTEFSKIRLQYNYDRREKLGEDHSVWLQFEFILGAHAAHKF